MRNVRRTFRRWSPSDWLFAAVSLALSALVIVLLLNLNSYS